MQARQESNDKHKTILHDIFEKNNDDVYLPSDRPRAIRLKTIQSKWTFNSLPCIYGIPKLTTLANVLLWKESGVNITLHA